jgi:hypothetical protein
MISEDFRRAVRTVGLAVARAIWRGCADGELSEEEAASLIAALEGRRGHAWVRVGLRGPDDRADKPARRPWMA